MSSATKSLRVDLHIGPSVGSAVPKISASDKSRFISEEKDEIAVTFSHSASSGHDRLADEHSWFEFPEIFGALSRSCLIKPSNANSPGAASVVRVAMSSACMAPIDHREPAQVSLMASSLHSPVTVLKLQRCALA